MDYYTKRHGMRAPIIHTSDITVEMYSLILGCCQKYYDNIAWKYPDECPDGFGCAGLNMNELDMDIKYEIPTLFKDEYGRIAVPRQEKNVFSNKIEVDEYDQYALLDFIEFIGDNVRDITSKSYHSYFGHYHLSFSSNNSVFEDFRNDINAIMKKTGLLFELNIDGYVERIEENSVLNKEIEHNVETVTEQGLKELIEVAIALHKSPRPSDHKDAVEKIWDALERLKTYYTSLDKKSSVTKIVDDMSNSHTSFVDLFNDEFKALTGIGNNYRIRHHETDKIDITDIKHYDYFFNRCLSLIALAIQYLH